MNATHRSAIVYHPDFLNYDFGPEHPLRPERLTLGLDLLERAGILRPDRETLRPAIASREELELVHDAAYVRAVEEAGSGWFPSSELARYGLAPGDNPPFPGMHEAAALIAGGTVAAAREVMSGRLDHAFNPAGGLHHAVSARASGFCIYNDPALAIATMRREFGARVLYVDFDCHHGDGVQWIFYNEPEVMTISFHESGRYLFPGTGGITETGEGAGRGFAVNVPFEPFTQDHSWLETVHSVLPPLVERFGPDVVVSAHGADTHIWDPLTHLSLTTAAFAEQAQLLHDLAHNYAQGRWIATGSGGYDWRRVVPRSWALLWSEMTGRPLPPQLPDSWLAAWEGSGAEALPTTYRDMAEASPPSPRRLEVTRRNREVTRSVLALHKLPETEYSYGET